MLAPHRAAAALLTILVSAVAFAADKPFDPKRDPAQDLAAAEAQAQAAHKNILLDVGGNWCGWCLVLDRFVHEQPEVRARLDRFVVVHVNWSMDNRNDAFLSRYGKPNAFPYYFVLSPEGKLLKAQSTDVFETDHKLGDGYSAEQLEKFFDRWSAPPAGAGKTT
jgi:thiol:disulfide interchange protein